MIVIAIGNPLCSYDIRLILPLTTPQNAPVKPLPTIFTLCLGIATSLHGDLTVSVPRTASGPLLPLAALSTACRVTRALFIYSTEVILVLLFSTGGSLVKPGRIRTKRRKTRHARHQTIQDEPKDQLGMEAARLGLLEWSDIRVHLQHHARNNEEKTCWHPPDSLSICQPLPEASKIVKGTITRTIPSYTALPSTTKHYAPLYTTLRNTMQSHARVNRIPGLW